MCRGLWPILRGFCVRGGLMSGTSLCQRGDARFADGPEGFKRVAREGMRRYTAGEEAAVKVALVSCGLVGRDGLFRKDVVIG